MVSGCLWLLDILRIIFTQWCTSTGGTSLDKGLPLYKMCLITLMLKMKICPCQIVKLIPLYCHLLPIFKVTALLYLIWFASYVFHTFTKNDMTTIFPKYHYLSEARSILTLCRYGTTIDRHYHYVSMGVDGGATGFNGGPHIVMMVPRILMMGT